MSYEDDVTITMELDERFDKLFGDENERYDGLESIAAFNLEDSPIKNLKVAVLSLDWEMTDENMERFIEELKQLRNLWKNDKVLVMFLKLLEGLGKYAKIRKDKSHPESIRLLQSAYEGLERIVLTEGMSGEEKVKIFQTEVTKFKELKQQIALAKGRIPQKVELSPVEAMKIEDSDHAVMEAYGGDGDRIDLEGLPLKNLKNIVSLLGSGITDETMQRLETEINRLRDEWKDDNVLLQFLQLLGGLEKYIRMKRDKAHPDSLRLLGSACESMEKAVLSGGMPEREKVRLFRVELKKFKELKERIALARIASSKNEEKISTQQLIALPREEQLHHGKDHASAVVMASETSEQQDATVEEDKAVILDTLAEDGASAEEEVSPAKGKWSKRLCFWRRRKKHKKSCAYGEVQAGNEETLPSSNN